MNITVRAALGYLGEDDKADYLAAVKPHLRNGAEFHSGGMTHDAAKAKAKEMRAKGTFASITHVGGPRTGPKSKWAVTTIKPR